LTGPDEKAAPADAAAASSEAQNGTSIEGSDAMVVENEGSKAGTPTATVANAAETPLVNAPTEFLGGYAIDVNFEASKLPLDVAIFNSARAAGGDDRIRKYLQAILVIGGTAHIPGMGYALESRFVKLILIVLSPQCELLTYGLDSKRLRRR
jgi:actin-related protein 8